MKRMRVVRWMLTAIKRMLHLTQIARRRSPSPLHRAVASAWGESSKGSPQPLLILKSIRRLRARPASVLLSAMGLSGLAAGCASDDFGGPGPGGSEAPPPPPPENGG